MLIGVWEIIKRALGLYEKNFKKFVGYALLGLVPGMLGGLLMMLAFSGLMLGGLEKGGLGIILGGFILMLIVAILIIITSIWVSIAVMRVVDAVYLGQPDQDFKQVMGGSWKVAWKSFATSFMSGLYAIWPLLIGGILSTVLALSFGTNSTGAKIALFLSGLVSLYGIFHLFYYSIRLSFSVYHAATTSAGVKESMNTSQNLIRGRWWAIFGRYLGVAVLVGLAMILVTSLLQVLSNTGDIMVAVTAVINIIIRVLIGPFIVSLSVIIYEETKRLGPVSRTPVAPPSPKI